MRGRKPLSPERRALRGNPSKRPIVDYEPHAPVSLPYLLAVPEIIASDPIASAKWTEKVRLLTASGVLTDLDADVLALYCQTWSILVAARKHLTDESGAEVLLVPSPNGHQIQNPYLAIVNRAMDRLRHLSMELGLTPLARSRVKTQIPIVPPADEFGEFDAPPPN